MAMLLHLFGKMINLLDLAASAEYLLGLSTIILSLSYDGLGFGFLFLGMSNLGISYVIFSVEAIQNE